MSPSSNDRTHKVETGHLGGRKVAAGPPMPVKRFDSAAAAASAAAFCDWELFGAATVPNKADMSARIPRTSMPAFER